MRLVKKITQLQAERQPFFSFEFFPPKTETGLSNLYARIDRMANLGPAFVDVTWGAGGSTSRLSLEISANVQRFLGTDVMLHLTCTNMSREQVEATLDEAHKAGVRNILALRGDPPKGATEWQAIEGGFRYAADLVAFIRKRHGDTFGIAVAGYPEGHIEAPSRDVCLERLKMKVDEGADFIITQLFYDVDQLLSFRDRCDKAGIRCPILPGLMPIQGFDGFMRFVEFCRVHVPTSVYERLEPIRHDDEAVKNYGVELCLAMCDRLRSEGISGFHFYTLNLESSVTQIVQALRPESDKAARALPWRPSAEHTRRQGEVRPIFWSNRPKSYVARSREWDDFPNGRWGDSTSPAFGSLSDYHLFHHGLLNETSRKALLEMYGEPQSEQDVADVFVGYLRGKIARLPWSEASLEPETSNISQDLLSLNHAGLLTINSQPQANGVDSADPNLGWGGPGGLVYQKAYLEVFLTPEALSRFEQHAAAHPSLGWMAMNRAGDRRSNLPERCVNAVTWGVFPGKEIIQPTIVDAESFNVWKDEAFDLWHTGWAFLYGEGTPSRQLLDRIRDSYYLLTVVENDYVRGDIFRVFRELLKG